MSPLEAMAMVFSILVGVIMEISPVCETYFDALKNCRLLLQ